MSPLHTDLVYEAELAQLRALLELMGRKIDHMLDDSMRALLERDRTLAERNIAFDHQVNRIEVEADELCLRMIARRQPVASDLRFITLALKLVTDLERVGDLCVNICERTLELDRAPAQAPPPEIEQMTEAVRSMVRDGLRAFLEGDEREAGDVMARDRRVDVQYAETMEALLERMMHAPDTISGATRYQSVAKYLERIGDHATNLAEMAVFRVRGKDVRHLGKLEEPEELLVSRRPDDGEPPS